MKKRKVEVRRKTKETNIVLKLNIDGSGKSKITTGIGILDHMLELFAFHGLFDLEISAKGDLKVDIHHTNEDIGIVLGEAFKKALGYKKGIKRFGSASVPMEEVVANVVVDISGRGFFKGIKIIKSSISTFSTPKGIWSVKGLEENSRFDYKSSEGYELEYANHFFEALAKRLGMNLNIQLQSLNPDLHTNLEPIFKALGIALDQATQIDIRRKGIPSTKGIID